MSMWRYFSENAANAAFAAKEEAVRRLSMYVSTEHLLLGICAIECSAVEVLRKLGATPEQVLRAIEEQMTPGENRDGEVTLTPRAKRAIDLAYSEVFRLRHGYVGTEHLLLGLLRERDGLAGRALEKLGISLEVARRTVEETPLSNERRQMPPLIRTAPPYASKEGVQVTAGHLAFMVPKQRLDLWVVLLLSDPTPKIQRALARLDLSCDDLRYALEQELLRSPWDRRQPDPVLEMNDGSHAIDIFRSAALCPTSLIHNVFSALHKSDDEIAIAFGDSS